MSDTPTPRTQAARCNVDTYADQYLFSHSTDGEWVRHEVTEQLERELNDAMAALRNLANEIGKHESASMMHPRLTRAIAASNRLTNETK